jgi:predicted SprT family Zn-dependent metalloprotease
MHDRPIHSIYCCMCPDEKFTPSKLERPGHPDGDLYWCKECGLQLTFKRVDQYSDWIRSHPEIE